MIRLTDEEIRQIVESLRWNAYEEVARAQILKITKKAKDKDISNGFRLALLEEVKQ